MTEPSRKMILVGGVVAVGVLALWWLATRDQGGSGAVTPGGTPINFAAPDLSSPIWQVPDYNLPTGQPIGTSVIASPGSSAIFNFGGGGAASVGASGSGPGGCGCGSADGATGPCNSPGATVPSYGSPVDQAVSFASVLPELIKQAFAIRQSVDTQIGYNVSAYGGQRPN